MELSEILLSARPNAQLCGRGQVPQRQWHLWAKMMNFRRFDPAYTGAGRVGLTRGNRDEETVWREFALSPVRLREVAAAIKATIKGGKLGIEADGDDIATVEAEEGRILTRLHRRRERNKKLVDLKKSRAHREAGFLRCEACGFDFEARYGERGRGFIECHHTKPVHTLADGHKTKLDDLALLCANCHRMVHSG